MAGYGAQYGVGTYGLEPSTSIPVLQNQSPANGAVDVAPYAATYLEVVDPDANIVASTVVITVNGVVAWSGDAEQPGFSVTKAAITDGFSYDIVPDRPAPRGSTVFVEVYAENDIPNPIEEHYSYVVGSKWFMLWRDDFDDNSIGINTSPGNGTITEPVGSDLVLTGPSGQDCNWWTSVSTAPYAYKAIDQWMKDGRTGAWQIKGRLSSFVSVSTGQAIGGGPMMYNDAQNAYLPGFYEGEDDFRVDRIISNAAGNRYNGPNSQPHPSSNPWQFLTIWNPSAKNIDVGPDGYLLAPGYVVFYYSTNDGSSWTRAYEEAMPVSVWNYIGVWLKKWGTTGSAVADIDYLELSEWPDPDLVYEQKEPGDSIGDAGVPINLTPKAGLEDASAPYTDMEGPPAHSSQLPAGVRLPGPPNQQTASVGPFDSAALEDKSTPLESVDSVGQLGALPLQALNPAQLGRATAGLEDASEYFASVLTDYRRDTTDGEGHPHFVGERVVYSWVYEAANEGGLWTTPTDPSFSGYGQDGHEYIAGVQQPAGPHAPWALETAGTDRSSRADFPDKVLICATFDGMGLTPVEIVIFDLDGYPATLDVWMRFRFAVSGGTYTMMGRVNQRPTKVRMANGILVVSTEEGDYRGGLHIVNFKATGNDAGHHIRSDNHFKWNGSIATRNTAGGWTTTGVSPSLRIDPEEVWHIDAYGTGLDTWLAIGGEDPGPQLLRIQDVPNWMIGTTGDVGADNVGDKRIMTFNEHGWLFFSVDNRLFRVLPADYEEGLMHFDATDRLKRIGSPATTVLFPTTIRGMKSEGRYIYLALESGIYMLHVATMEFWLAYTAVGHGGKGYNNGTPGDGELLAGGDSDVNGFHITRRYMTELSSWMHYLTVATRSGVTVIRLWDEVVVDARTFNDLHEPGAWFNASKVE